MSEKENYFIITIDTEGDNLWNSPRDVSTKNSEYLPRFQKLCEKYKLKTVYLTDYRMASSVFFTDFAKDVIKNNSGEIGMHLHAWDSPPEYKLTNDDIKFQPYLVEYPPDEIRNKVRFLTDFLQEKFNTKMLSHRSGRWSFNENYARILAENGYIVDCSVTPHVSWKNIKGDPNSDGGSDFEYFPDKPYFLNMNDISKEGDSSILEVPVSIDLPPGYVNFLFKFFKRNSKGWKILNRLFIHERWLRPNGRNLCFMKEIVKKTHGENKKIAEFMLHSSELMPGGSPTFKNESDIEKLYSDLELLFDYVNNSGFKGVTLKEFYYIFKDKNQVAAN